MHIPPPAIMLIALILMRLPDLFVPQFSFDLSGISEIVKLLFGGLFILAGLLIGIVAVAKFFKQKTTVQPHKLDEMSVLVTSGLYRYSRNPMYLGMASIILGFGLVLGTLSLILILPMFIVTMNRIQIIPEEKALLRLFGQDYLDYQKQVRRWL